MVPRYVLERAGSSREGKGEYSCTRPLRGVPATCTEMRCSTNGQSNFLPRGAPNYTERGDIGFSVPHAEITFDCTIDWQKHVTDLRCL